MYPFRLFNWCSWCVFCYGNKIGILISLILCSTVTPESKWFCEIFFRGPLLIFAVFFGPHPYESKKISGPTPKSHHFMHENVIICPFFLFLNFHSQIFFRAHFLDFKILNNIFRAHSFKSKYFSGPVPQPRAYTNKT